MLERRPRPNLPTIPTRMRTLPIEERGYPVPWFVQWIDGAPDFRVMDRKKFERAVRFGNCWLCGEILGRFRTYVIGPMCGITRTTSEPGSHQECAEFAARACPFMTLPKAQYREVKFAHQEAPGMALTHNPGCCALWTTSEFHTFESYGGNAGTLLRLGDPRNVEWYAEGVPATRAQVLASIALGYPALEAQARIEGSQALAHLGSMRREFSRWLPV